MYVKRIAAFSLITYAENSEKLSKYWYFLW